MLRSVLCLLFLLTACETTPVPAGDLSGAPTADLSTPPSTDLSPAGAACIGKAECACYGARADCQAITEPCYCPTTCNGQLCVCGGGKFHACAPRESGCNTVVSCRPAGRVTPQDARGCVDCSYQATCTQAAEALRAGCPTKVARLTALSCDRAPDCVARCINDLKTCDDIGCGLCGACGCVGNGPFEQCVFKC